MNMAMQAAPPSRRTPVVSKKKPKIKQRPSVTLTPTTPRYSKLAICNFNNNDFIWEKNALFRSFSKLCLMPSLVEFLDSDELLDDSKLNIMCTEWEASTNAMAGSTEEEVEFNTSLASLFGSLTDLLTNKRAFDKKDCLTLQQELERLKTMRRQIAMSADEYKIDAAGFPQTPPHTSSIAPSRKQPSLGRQHEGDMVQLQQERRMREEEVLEEQKSGTESICDLVTRPSRSSEFEFASSPVTPRSRSPTSRSDGNRRSPKSPSRRSHRSMDDDSGKPGGKPSGTSLRRTSSSHSLSPRKRSVLAATLRTSCRSGPSRSPITPRRSQNRASPIIKSPRKFLQMDPLGVSKSMRSPITPTMTPRRSRSRALSSVKTVKLASEFLPKDPLGVLSESAPAPFAPTRFRSGACSPVKSPRLPRIYLKELEDVMASIRAAQLDDPPRSSREKGSTGRVTTNHKQSPSSVYHFAKDRVGALDSHITGSPRSSPGARSQAQSQTLSNQKMLSNREMLICKLKL